MKDDAYTEIICKGFCRYYKEGREELHCNGYVFLRDNFTPYELRLMLSLPMSQRGVQSEGPSGDEETIDLVCRQCDFFIDECDYTDNRSGPPCGGYILINRLCG